MQTKGININSSGKRDDFDDDEKKPYKRLKPSQGSKSADTVQPKRKRGRESNKAIREAYLAKRPKPDDAINRGVPQVCWHLRRASSNESTSGEEWEPSEGKDGEASNASSSYKFTGEYNNTLAPTFAPTSEQDDTEDSNSTLSNEVVLENPDKAKHIIVFDFDGTLATETDIKVTYNIGSKKVQFVREDKEDRTLTYKDKTGEHTVSQDRIFKTYEIKLRSLEKLQALTRKAIEKGYRVCIMSYNTNEEALETAANSMIGKPVSHTTFKITDKPTNMEHYVQIGNGEIFTSVITNDPYAEAQNIQGSRNMFSDPTSDQSGERDEANSIFIFHPDSNRMSGRCHGEPDGDAGKPAILHHLALYLGVRDSNIHLCDDDINIIKAAQAHGIDAHLITTEASLSDAIDKIDGKINGNLITEESNSRSCAPKTQASEYILIEPEPLDNTYNFDFTSGDNEFSLGNNLNATSTHQINSTSLHDIDINTLFNNFDDSLTRITNATISSRKDECYDEIIGNFLDEQVSAGRGVL